jgi:hypothetical protein
MAFSATSMVPGAYTDSHATAEFNLGSLSVATDGTIYRYVEVKDIDLVLGSVVCYDAAQANGYVVSADRSGDETSDLCAGVAVAAVDISAAAFCWLQVSGYCATVRTATGLAAGESIVPHTVDEEGEGMAAGAEDHVFAMALTTAAGSPLVVDAILHGII